MKLNEKYEFHRTPHSPEDAVAYEENLDRYLRGAESGTRYLTALSAALYGVRKVQRAKLPTSASIDIRAQGRKWRHEPDMPITAPYKTSRVARLVRSVQAGEVDTTRSHDQHFWESLRASEVASSTEIVEDSVAEASSCIDLAVVLTTTYNRIQHMVASAVWQVKCSEESEGFTQIRERWSKGMLLIIIHLLGSHELSGTDMGGHVFDERFMRMKVIPDGAKTLIAFDVAPAFFEDFPAPGIRFLTALEALRGSLMSYMPYSFGFEEDDDGEEGRAVLWKNFALAASRFGHYSMDCPPPRLDVWNPVAGTAELLLKEWTVNQVDDPTDRDNGRHCALQRLTTVLEDQFSRYAAGDITLDEVNTFIAKCEERIDDSWDEDWESEDSYSSIDIHPEELVAFFNNLGVGFVAVDTGTMDKLLEEARVFVSPESTTKTAAASNGGTDAEFESVGTAGEWTSVFPTRRRCQSSVT
jgi:hypothetical protein